ncbi:hypothetical protein DNTS_026954, partial [Danionella cerebrum]
MNEFPAMRIPAVVFSLLFSVMSLTESSCPKICSCVSGVVNCSHRGLTTASLPSSFPAVTSELLLNDNHLTSVPPGLLETLPALRRASMHGNPWACDCAILSFRAWLIKNRGQEFARNVSCSSPAHLRGRLIMFLAEQELLDSCRYWLCDLALASQISLFIFTGLQLLLLAAVILFLRRFERLAREAQRTAAESLAAEDENAPQCGD